MGRYSPSLALLSLGVTLAFIQCRTSARRQSEPFGITYGPVTAHKLKDADAKRIWDMKYVETISGRKKGYRSYLTWLIKEGSWSRRSYVPAVFAIEHHGLVAGLLGNTEMYIMERPSFVGGPFPEVVAVSGGRVYDEWQFGILLRDFGMRFGPEDVKDWARLLAFRSICRDSFLRMNSIWEDGPDDNYTRLWLHVKDSTLPTPEVPVLKFDSVRVLGRAPGKDAWGPLDVQVFVKSGGVEDLIVIKMEAWERESGDTVCFPSRQDYDNPNDGGKPCDFRGNLVFR